MFHAEKQLRAKGKEMRKASLIRVVDFIGGLLGVNRGVFQHQKGIVVFTSHGPGQTSVKDEMATFENWLRRSCYEKVRSQVSKPEMTWAMLVRAPRNRQKGP